MKKIMKVMITICLITICSVACGSSFANEGTAASGQSVSEEDKNNVDDKDYSQENSSGTGRTKEYFDERPDIQTPSSMADFVELDHAENETYYYSFGWDEEKAKMVAAAYMAYLEENGYDVEDVTDKIDSPSAVSFLIKKNGKSDGGIVYAMVEDIGYTFVIGWY